jgi:hypothetical protein
MSDKIKAALAAAFIMGTASTAALARGSYGGPVQTWQSIAQEGREFQNIENGIRRPSRYPGTAYDYAAPRKQSSRVRSYGR